MFSLVLFLFGMSLMLNVVLVVRDYKKKAPVAFEVSQEVSVEKAPIAQEHKHYRWRNPETNEVMYYGITSKDDVAQRFQADANHALSIVYRYRKLAEMQEQGLHPIVEVYAISPDKKTALKKEYQDIRDGILRGEPLLNSQNHNTVTKFRMNTQVVSLLSGPPV